MGCSANKDGRRGVVDSTTRVSRTETVEVFDTGNRRREGLRLL